MRQKVPHLGGAGQAHRQAQPSGQAPQVPGLSEAVLPQERPAAAHVPALGEGPVHVRNLPPGLHPGGPPDGARDLARTAAEDQLQGWWDEGGGGWKEAEEEAVGRSNVWVVHQECMHCGSPCDSMKRRPKKGETLSTNK
uniref:(northern house mosquito) hypothetical protein n=1 Tax=Culex pipiens TaxID=7175 RepID=A0A8D8MZ62_CULPI